MSDLSIDIQIFPREKTIKVFYEEELKATLYHPVYKKYLKKMGQMTLKEFLEFIKEHEKPIAKSYALFLLGKQSYSEKKLTRNLEGKFFSKDAIAYVLDLCRRYGFIDDQALWQFKVRVLIKKSYGKEAIYQKLFLDFDLSKTELENFLSEEIDQTEQVEMLYNLLKKKQKGKDCKEKRRLYFFLKRRGHNSSICTEVLSKLFS